MTKSRAGVLADMRDCPPTHTLNAPAAGSVELGAYGHAVCGTPRSGGQELSGGAEGDRLVVPEGPSRADDAPAARTRSSSESCADSPRTVATAPSWSRPLAGKCLSKHPLAPLVHITRLLPLRRLPRMCFTFAANTSGRRAARPGTWQGLARPTGGGWKRGGDPALSADTVEDFAGAAVVVPAVAWTSAMRFSAYPSDCPGHP